MLTSKRASIAATAIMVLAALTIASAQSRFRNDLEERQTVSRNARAVVGEVPADVRENMDPHLIDFVVGGFPKCGTTYLQNKILYESKKIYIPHHETHFLANDKYDEFKEEFANATRPQQTIGYKSPFELGHQRSLKNLQALFPDVRMIITLRHPVLQFESLYNYKLRKLPELIPPVDEYVGNCLEQCMLSPPPQEQSSSSSGETLKTKVVARKASQKCLEGVTFCTGESSYHQYLSRLGLTPMNTPEELELLNYHKMSIHKFPGWETQSSNSTSATRGNNNQMYIRSPGWKKEVYTKDSKEQSSNNGKLFLIEIGQFDNRVNQSMADDVVSDLENFLGLNTGDLPREPPHSGNKKPKPEYVYPPGREDHVLDICLDQYKLVRDVLLEGSRKAAKWIMEYLLHPSNRDLVIVSNIDIFQKMVEEWMFDPCANEDRNPE